MKYMLGLLILASLATAYAAPTATPLKFQSDSIEFAGSTNATTKFNALVIYVPDTGKSSSQACTFAEDRHNMNGSSVVQSFKTEGSSSLKYSLKIPTRGLRGSCHYVLQTIYLGIQDLRTTENLRIDSTDYVSVTHTDEDLSYVPRPLIASLKNLYCEFSAEAIGLCSTEEGSMTAVGYQVSLQPQKIELNVRDASEL